MEQTIAAELIWRSQAPLELQQQQAGKKQTNSKPAKIIIVIIVKIMEDENKFAALLLESESCFAITATILSAT